MISLKTEYSSVLKSADYKNTYGKIRFISFAGHRMIYALNSLDFHRAMDGVIWSVFIPHPVPSEFTGISDRRTDLCMTV